MRPCAHAHGVFMQVHLQYGYRYMHTHIIQRCALYSYEHTDRCTVQCMLMYVHVFASSSSTQLSFGLILFVIPARPRVQMVSSETEESYTAEQFGPTQHVSVNYTEFLEEVSTKKALVRFLFEV